MYMCYYERGGGGKEEKKEERKRQKKSCTIVEQFKSGRIDKDNRDYLALFLIRVIKMSPAAKVFIGLKLA